MVWKFEGVKLSITTTLSIGARLLCLLLQYNYQSEGNRLVIIKRKKETKVIVYGPISVSLVSS